MNGSGERKKENDPAFRVDLICSFAGVLSQRGPEFDNMNTAGSPIVLQRRGSVYGANVPMITGISNKIVLRTNTPPSSFLQFLIR